MTREAHLEELRAHFEKGAISASISHGTLVIEVTNDAFLEMVGELHRELGFDLFLDVTAIDWKDAVPRFEVVHHFYSTSRFVRVRLKQRVPEENRAVDSLVPLFGSARYMERECHDMYGIDFRGNADLRPILLYEGFEGHPLCKDYPKEKEQPLLPARIAP